MKPDKIHRGLRVKKGVVFIVMTFEILAMLHFLSEMVKNIKKDMWVTSANDGSHREKSKHYENLALDVRGRHLSKPEAIHFMRQFKIFFEDKGYLCQFEWREKVFGKWVKYKTNRTKSDWKKIVGNYYSCKNEKVCHFHMEKS